MRRRRPVARVATTAVVAGTAANMGAKSAQRSAAAAQAHKILTDARRSLYRILAADDEPAEG